jgi:hypothetical protein
LGAVEDLGAGGQQLEGQVLDHSIEQAEAPANDDVDAEMQKSLVDDYHLPLLEVSSCYAAGFEPKLVTEVDVPKEKEGLYGDVVKVLHAVSGDGLD